MPERNGTAEIASFAAQTCFEDLPADVVHQARRCAVDCLACALGGVSDPSLDKHLAVNELLGGQAQARIWGTPHKANVALAALINGHLAHVLDFDDSYMPEVTILHANAPVMPAAMAMAELLGAGGKAFTLAFALGFEIAARTALAAGRALYNQRWHVTGMVGPIGAAIAAGKVLGLSEPQLVWAIGIAASQTGGMGHAHGSMTKAFHAGRAAHAGVLAALLAREGFTSGPDPLTGDQALLSVLPSDGDLDGLLSGLGDRWEIRQAAFKAYACGIVQHSVLDGVIALRNEHGLVAEDVEAIELRVTPAVGMATGKRSPQTGLEGKFSVYHSAAVGLIDGAAGPEQYTDARVQDPRVQALRGRVSMEIDSAVHKDEAFVRIQLRGDRIVERHVEHASGTAQNPLTDQQLEDKLRLLGEPVLGVTGGQELLATLNALTELDAMSELTDRLRPRG